MDAEFDGRKASAMMLKSKMIPAIPFKVVNCGINAKIGADKNKLKDWTLKLPILSVNQPPSKEPITDPIPKVLSTIPASIFVKCSSLVTYTAKNGITMAPVRFNNITKANIQAGFDNPENESTYNWIGFLKITVLNLCSILLRKTKSICKRKDYFPA